MAGRPQATAVQTNAAALSGVLMARATLLGMTLLSMVLFSIRKPEISEPSRDTPPPRAPVKMCEGCHDKIPSYGLESEGVKRWCA